MYSKSWPLAESVLLCIILLASISVLSLLNHTSADKVYDLVDEAIKEYSTLVRNDHRSSLNIFLQRPGKYDKKYASFDEKLRLQMLNLTREMFYFGYDNYMKYAFPKDELNPIDCTGRGPDFDNP
ncbi:ER degradation-enhancing alpha-mannosidase-like 1-like protein [Dinothrombium tinctorium]|nr:ER degradation-enhancing alpha-mannosidase-like 1-like protein [Dinothrombium tinctorium]